jgi:hypothetical protein
VLAVPWSTSRAWRRRETREDGGLLAIGWRLRFREEGAIRTLAAGPLTRKETGAGPLPFPTNRRRTLADLNEAAGAADAFGV